MTTADLKNLAGELPQVIAQIMAGNEVVLTRASEPVARIVPIAKDDGEGRRSLPPLKVRSFARPRVLTPNFTHAEIAEEMFNRE